MAAPMTAARYRRAWNRLYVASMKAGSAAECAEIQAKLDRLNARYEASKAAS